MLSSRIVECSRSGMGTSMASFAHFVMDSSWVWTMLSLKTMLIDVAQSLWTPSAATRYSVATTFLASVCGGISLAIAGSWSCICATLFARSLGLNFVKGQLALLVS